MKKILKTRVLPVLIIAIMSIATVTFTTSNVQAASCTPPGDFGKVTSTITIPSTGDYRVWSRIKAVDSTHNTYLIKIDNTCYNVGGSTAYGAWKWVDHQDNNVNSKIQLNGLTAGAHTVEFIGNADGVELDRIILTQDFNCLANASPTDLGDSCANPVTVVNGDTNNDGIVNITDLNRVLLNWGKTGQNVSQGNFTSPDTTVNIADLNIILLNWTR